jgi:serine/threonine protein kinase
MEKGSIVGEYEIIEYIKSGSYGKIYKAINLKEEKLYAIKELAL